MSNILIELLMIFKNFSNDIFSDGIDKIISIFILFQIYIAGKFGVFFNLTFCISFTAIQALLSDDR